MYINYRICMATVVAAFTGIASHAYPIKVTNYTKSDSWVAVYHHDTERGQLYRTSGARHLAKDGATTSLAGVSQNYGAVQFELYQAASAGALKPRLSSAALGTDVAFVMNVGNNETHFFMHDPNETTEPIAELELTPAGELTATEEIIAVVEENSTAITETSTEVASEPVAEATEVLADAVAADTTGTPAEETTSELSVVDASAPVIEEPATEEATTVNEVAVEPASESELSTAAQE